MPSPHLDSKLRDLQLLLCADTYFSLFVTCISIVLCCHWFACVWGLQASFNRSGSWLGSSGYCVLLGGGVPPAGVTNPSPKLSSAEVAAFHAACPPEKTCYSEDCDAGKGLCRSVYSCEPSGSTYVYALYWSVMTISSVGYGDVSASAFNTVEQLICVFMMLCGGMLWSYLIGTFCGIAAVLTPGVKEFRDLMSALNCFMQVHNLPDMMRIKLREYIHESAHLMRAKRENEMLGYLSRQMHSEVSWFVNRVWLERVWYLRTSDLSSDASSMRSVLLDLSCRLKAVVFPPGELCPAGLMYIVARG